MFVSSCHILMPFIWKDLICNFLYCFKFLFQFQPSFYNKKFLSIFVVILNYHHEIETRNTAFAYYMAIHLLSANSFAALAASLYLYRYGVRQGLSI